MTHDLLTRLQRDAKLTAKELAALTDQNEQAVEAEISRLEKSGVICGYHALINWEKTEKETVTALIEVKVTPALGKGFDHIAARIYHYDEVRSVYLMSGGYDLGVIVEGKTMKDIAYFVSYKLATLESVHSVATHFVLKKYKDHGVVINSEASDDERMIVTP